MYENKSLKIRTKGMFGGAHSWAVSMRSIFQVFHDMGHECFIVSTNGTEFVSDSLLSRVGLDIDDPDIDITYTMPINFNFRFAKQSKLKIALFNYESDVLPKDFLRNISVVDYIAPSSKYCYDIFINGGLPQSKCCTIPLGVNKDFYTNKKFQLKTSKSFNFLNVSIPHYRKNIDMVVQAYYNAFTDDDDVCLVLKTKLKRPSERFEIDVAQMLQTMQKRFGSKKLPQIEVVTQNIEDITQLYATCNSIVSASASEGFGLPLLEAMAAGKIVIAPNATGQTDFLNHDNSILIPCTKANASPQYQYWKASNDAFIYKPNIDLLSQSMIDVFENESKYKSLFSLNMKKTVELFSWTNTANKILSLYNGGYAE